MSVIEEGRQATYVIVMKVRNQDSLRFFYQIFLYEAGIYGKAAVYEESLALPGEESGGVSKMDIVSAARTNKKNLGFRN